jgi:hypothetical protein
MAQKGGRPTPPHSTARSGSVELYSLPTLERGLSLCAARHQQLRRSGSPTIWHFRHVASQMNGSGEHPQRPDFAGSTGRNMSKWSDLVAYYEERYQIATAWCLRPGDKIFLGDKQNRRCRFCGKTEPEVSFRNDAHALPECTGNKSLFTYYECDVCNKAFGDGCDNDFGNWSLPMRTMSRIRGKNGIPIIKQGPSGASRIDDR